IKSGTLVERVYGAEMISERHRHRWEVNNVYRDRLEERGLVLAGTSPDGFLVEIVELPEHPWFVGVQFHPEFQSRPLKPHPLFVGFIGAALNARDERCASGASSSAPKKYKPGAICEASSERCG
ncbi:MAG TPA: gamma-glutamyl-gamma-aminobutyrate hydrolase family protein, partial [Oligoflexia bacterium]|nr:gamma-glutamyl-gamma-aminobutyrate hydrolase family protein [Oligoflexia bacterium]